MEATLSEWPLSEGQSPSDIYRQLQQNQQNRTHRPRKKLRESCNNCALSKVKCSKEQPVCARCDEREMYCHYSPTRRTGKRRAATHPPAEGGPKVTLSLKDITPPDDAHFYDYHGLVLTQDMLSREDPLGARNSERNGSSQSLSGLMSPPLSLHLQTGKSIGDTQSQIHGSMFSPKAMDMNMFGDSNSMGPTLGYMTDHQSDVSMGAGIYEDQEPLLDMMNEDPSFSMLMPLSDNELREPGSGTKSECQPDQPQHCMKRALDILQRLHTPPSKCNLAPDSKVEPVATRSARSVDEVLSTNKEILDVVHQILDCACSLDIQLAFILTTITSKIISWYSAVAQNNEDQRSGSTSGSTPRGRATSPAASPEYVSNLPVTVAKYQVDGQSKGKMQAQLVLCELHLVLRLIDKLVIRFKGLRSREKGGLDSEAMDEEPASSPVFAELETFLRRRLRMLAKETTEVLRTS